MSDTPVVFGEGDRVLRSDLNPKQTIFYDRVIAAASDDTWSFEPDNANNPKLHLLCGRAGTGKTYVTAALQNHLELMGIRCAAVAFMWSAVYQMKVTCEKHSIHSFLGMSIDDLQPERVAKMDIKSSQVEKAERSTRRTRGPVCGRNFHLRFSAFACFRHCPSPNFNPDEPFGGIFVILLGDFGQLPPVQAKSLAELAVLSARRNDAGENRTGDKDLVEAEAARLFTMFRRMDLETAMRSQKDPDWSAFTARFDPSFADPPITPAHLEKLKNMRLSPGAASGKPVSGVCRCGRPDQLSKPRAINDLQIVPLRSIGWMTPSFRTVSARRVHGRASAKMPPEGYIAMDTGGACELEQFWVRGMPVVVGERPPALSPSYGIANGRHGFFHSFGFDDPAAATGDWSDHPRHFNDGDAVEVPSPDFINVKFLFDKPKGREP